MKFTEMASFSVLPTHGMKQNKTGKKQKKRMGNKTPIPWNKIKWRM